MIEKDPDLLGYASREERYTPIYGLLLLICPIVTVLLMLAAEVSYMRAQAMVVPPLPSGVRWLVRIQVVIILVATIMNLVLARWHLKYLSSYRKASTVGKLVLIGVFSSVVIAVHFFVFYVVALVNAV